MISKNFPRRPGKILHPAKTLQDHAQPTAVAGAAATSVCSLLRLGRSQAQRPEVAGQQGTGRLADHLVGREERRMVQRMLAASTKEQHQRGPAVSEGGEIV